MLPKSKLNNEYQSLLNIVEFHIRWKLGDEKFEHSFIQKTVLTIYDDPEKCIFTIEKKYEKKKELWWLF